MTAREQSQSVFISFRRIRYHEASLAYRDLMLSGLTPWLSDHCITTESALRFSEDSSELAPLLLDTIRASDCALVLADGGYFESAWTRLEYAHLLQAGCPVDVVYPASADERARVLPRDNSRVVVHDTVREALAAITSRAGMDLVPFAGTRLTYALPASIDRVLRAGMSAGIPSWFGTDPTGRMWETAMGDGLWFSSAPVMGPPATEIVDEVSRLAADPSRLYDLFESELWGQVRRLHHALPRGASIIGYHKFPVAALNSTAVAVSLQLNDAGGFVRFASVVDPARSIKLQMACFLRGSLQRFHWLIPDVDEIVLSLSEARASAHTEAIPVRTYEPGATRFADLTWARCGRCHKALPPIAEGQTSCPFCGYSVVECRTVHCRNRRHMTFPVLLEEAARERATAQRPYGESTQSVYDAGLLCQGCLGSFFIPGTMIESLEKRPEQSMPVVWSPRQSLLLLWLIACLYGVYATTGYVYRWGLGTIAFVTWFEPYEAGAKTDPMSRAGKRLHLLTIIPFVLCGAWLAANASGLTTPSPAGTVPFSGSADSLVVSASLVLISFVLRPLGLEIRYREPHLIFAAIIAAGCSLMYLLQFSRLAGSCSPAVLWTALAVSVVAAIIAVALAFSPRVTGQFEPERLWEQGGAE
jgi:hypothetical protein